MISPSAITLVTPALITWTEGKSTCTALWRSERAAPVPKRVVLADDTLSADTAYRLACEGTGLLWRGDFQNARLLLQSLARRIDKPPKASKTARQERKKTANDELNGVPAGQAFHLYRQARAQRARVLGMVLIEFAADCSIALRRAPDAKQACIEAWGPTIDGNSASVASLRELMGVISAHEWRKKGVEIPALTSTGAVIAKAGSNNRIYPHYTWSLPCAASMLILLQPHRCPLNAPQNLLPSTLAQVPAYWQLCWRCVTLTR